MTCSANKRIAIRIWICLGLLILTGCSSSADSPAAGSGTTDTGSIDPLTTMEQQVHQQVNDYRSSYGLADLQWRETIADYCRTHSQNMANGTVAFSHDGFDARVDGIGQTIAYQSAAENVARNDYSDPATTAVQGWLTSPGHLANIQGDFDLTGVGVAQRDDGMVYFTQIFIKSL